MDKIGKMVNAIWRIINQTIRKLVSNFVVRRPSVSKDRKVIEPNSIAEQLLYSTVRICGDSSTGTGFFFKYPINESSQIELILTNKHVVQGNKKLEFYFHEAINNDGKNQPTSKSFSI